jgi:hypothetical protein
MFQGIYEASNDNGYCFLCRVSLVIPWRHFVQSVRSVFYCFADPFFCRVHWLVGVSIGL